MTKYYLILLVIAGGFLFYVFRQDPCNQMLRADFSDRNPDYEILDTGAIEGSPDSVSCHIYYEKPDSKQVYEEIWLYQNSDDGWKFSRILQSGASEAIS
jgi:hypothetical protein